VCTCPAPYPLLPSRPLPILKEKVQFVLLLVIESVGLALALGGGALESLALALGSSIDSPALGHSLDRNVANRWRSPGLPVGLELLGAVGSRIRDESLLRSGAGDRDLLGLPDHVTESVGDVDRGLPRVFEDGLVAGGVVGLKGEVSKEGMRSEGSENCVLLGAKREERREKRSDGWPS